MLTILLLSAVTQSAIAQLAGCISGRTDPCYNQQWHLKNTGQSGGTSGEDINVDSVWKQTLKNSDKKIRGQGIYIAIVDRELKLDHEDLVDNISTAHNHDYYPNSIDTDSHATNVAGIAAARGYNLKGVRGVAPWAKIYGLNLISSSSPSLDSILDSITRHTTITAVSNNSWAHNWRPFQPFGPASFSPGRNSARMLEAALETGITEGFHGKGTVYVRTAGNDHCPVVDTRTNKKVCGADNANYNGYANHHTSVTVCAVNHNGIHNGSSEFGANLWICAPSGGIYTTSNTRRGYTRGFGGTSAAAPMVSGVVALMRQVNPSLGWRDVKLILANSARQNDAGDDDWTQGGIKYGSFSDDADARYRFNHKYGFGVVNAQKAVELSQNWTNLPDSITDTTTNHTFFSASTITSNIFMQSDINYIEYVYINTAFRTGNFSDLSIKLISPFGTTSHLVIPADEDFVGAGDERWRFGSAKHLGEDPSGTWKLELENLRDSSSDNQLSSWGLTIHGHQIKLDASPAVELSDLNVTQTTLSLSLAGAKWKKNLQLNDFRLENAPAGLRIENVRRTSDTQVHLGLVLDESFTKDYLFQVIATTDTVSNLSGSLTSNDVRIVLDKSITVRKDVLIPDGISGVSHHFELDNVFASSQKLTYTISGVPPGLMINGSIISGKPTVPGDYRLMVVATREDGISRTEFFNLRIRPYTIQVQLRVLLEGALIRHR